MKEIGESQKVEKTLTTLFADRMKHNQRVFKADIMDEEKPKKKLKKRDAIESDDG